MTREHSNFGWTTRMPDCMEPESCCRIWSHSEVTDIIISTKNQPKKEEVYIVGRELGLDYPMEHYFFVNRGDRRISPAQCWDEAFYNEGYPAINRSLTDLKPIARKRKSMMISNRCYSPNWILRWSYRDAESFLAAVKESQLMTGAQKAKEYLEVQKPKRAAERAEQKRIKEANKAWKKLKIIEDLPLDQQNKLLSD